MGFDGVNLCFVLCINNAKILDYLITSRIKKIYSKIGKYIKCSKKSILLLLNICYLNAFSLCNLIKTYYITDYLDNVLNSFSILFEKKKR